jgi:hypothetical protein
MKGGLNYESKKVPQGYISIGRFQITTGPGEFTGKAEKLGYGKDWMACSTYYPACLAGIRALYGRPGRARGSAPFWQGSNSD